MNSQKNNQKFLVAYAKTNRSICRSWKCRDTKIVKDSLRFAEKVQNKFADSLKPQWYHEECFFKKFTIEEMEWIQDFTTIKAVDKPRIRDIIAGCSAKKRSASNANLDNIDNISYLEVPEKRIKLIELDKQDLIFEQNIEKLDVYEKKNNILTDLLKANHQQAPSNVKERKKRLADIMMFGWLDPCSKCSKGQLVLTDFAYVCSARRTRFTKCQYFTTDPVRHPMVVPTANEEAFLECKPIVGGRIFPDKKTKSEAKNLESYLSDLTIDRKLPIEKFKTDFYKTGTGKVSLQLKKGGVVDPESGLAHMAQVYKYSDERETTLYSIAMVKVDVGEAKNSYYKMQLLEADDVNNNFKYWVFRSWGRIGTNRGCFKNYDFNSLDDAKAMFNEVFKKKTNIDCSKGYEDIESYCEPQEKALYFPIEVDYSSLLTTALLDDETCDLDMSVKSLVKKIFDVELMERTLLQFELDTNRMPLGKLSEKQISGGYEMLSKLQAYLRDGTDKDQDIINDYSNKFYTVIPHNCGNNNPPVIDCIEMIKKKSEMLDILREIRIAYSLRNTDENPSIQSCYLRLKTQLTILNRECPEYDITMRYAETTAAAGGQVHVKQVFRVVREGEAERYRPFSKLHNRRLLWHGSPVTNFAGILSQVWGVGRRQPDPDRGHTLAEGTLVPLGPCVNVREDDTELTYNEFVVYDVAQVNVKYLLEIEVSEDLNSTKGFPMSF